MLTRNELRRVYDRVGSWQDSQSFYEAPAVDALLQHGAFDQAHSVLEVGCGTGRLAERLLSMHLPPESAYRAEELSSVMAGLARERVAPWAERASVVVTEGAPPLHVEDNSVDRLAAAYVLDLMPRSDVRAFLEEAERVLTPEGRLCCCGLAPGTGWLDSAVSHLWSGVHALMPTLVGGCRPLDVRSILPDGWRVQYHEYVAPWGVSSDVLVAVPPNVAF